ncbi:amidohydrolase family protein [Pyxidicoccus fallax]|uniref:Amidohydrolase family protein n=1 Tax=Pyxidicoccus fallax TaxID=394095 RepID=A0A848LFL1_9BACT|nr:amidohydrolase family protein [Pyxidicoccus fallax]NMO17274.1 amidohydrolase family protein [Pyxidicoccus fallax]NPC78983.1 amidohydrolase family protein [Pyxidicoccus fallax]
MEGRLLLKNCAVFRADGRVRTGMAVVVEGNTIRRVAPDAQVPVLPGDWEVACRGRLVASGLVDCHSHLVNGQLLPASGYFLLLNPRERLERMLRVARLVTAEDVEALTRFAAARALRHGVTMVVDHLSCHDVAGGLAAQARAAESVGLRLVASHATHSLDGDSQAQTWLADNAEFASRHREHPLVRGALGFHASYTCDHALLTRVSRLSRELDTPTVFHLAESEDDLTTTYSRHGQRVVPRLDALGLLGPNAIAGYARALDTAEATRLAESGTFVALAPRGVRTLERGVDPMEAVVSRIHLLGLGTGGHGSLQDELLAATVGVLRIARAGRLPDVDNTLAHLLVNGPAELCTRLFGLPSGNVEEGSLADLVVYDTVPPADPETGYSPHLLGQVSGSPVAWTVVNGRVCVREGQLLGHDYIALSHAATEALHRVWTRARLGS